MIHAQRQAYDEAERSFRNALDRGPRTGLAYRELGRDARVRTSDARALLLDAATTVLSQADRLARLIHAVRG